MRSNQKRCRASISFLLYTFLTQSPGSILPTDMCVASLVKLPATIPAWSIEFIMRLFPIPDKGQPSRDTGGIIIHHQVTRHFDSIYCKPTPTCLSKDNFIFESDKIIWRRSQKQYDGKKLEWKQKILKTLKFLYFYTGAN